MHTVSLKQLRQEARDVKLKVGDHVVFLPMGGIWGELASMTGHIVKKNRDPIWRYDVEIEFPHLLYVGSTHHMQKNDFITTVGPTGIEKITPSILKDWGRSVEAKLNQGEGVAPTSPVLSKHAALRALWKEIRAMDEKQLEMAKRHPDDAWFRSEGKHAEKGIVFADKKLASFTAKIEKLKAAGFVEPTVKGSK